MSTPRRSAAVILHRDGPSGLEVFLVMRSPHLRFLGGHLAFPGGAVEPGDALFPMLAGEGVPGVPVTPEDRELIGCAARELCEEAALLEISSGRARAISSADLTSLQRALSEHGKSSAAFGSFLEQRGLSIDASRFRLAARFITPSFSGIRFDTTFFLVKPKGEPVVIPGELVSGAWRRPAGVLEEWRGGKVRVAAPVIDILAALAEHPLETAIEALRAIPPDYEGSGLAVRAAPGYDIVPLETPPLPPEIPTNTFLVGWKRFVVIDPAPRRENQRKHLFDVIDRRLEVGDDLLAVVLTHHHPDHVGALDAVVERYRSPVWAHTVSGHLLALKLDRELSDGDEIALGADPGGLDGWALRALFTPGHAEGHLVFHDERSRSLIAGDLVSTLVSMYVGSPGGNLREYFASLERIRELAVETLYPSHGTPSRDPAKLIDDTLRRRKERIEEVFAALGEGPRETEPLALEIYPEASGKLRPLIVRTTRASLEHLVEEGRAEKCGADVFRRR